MPFAALADDRGDQHAGQGQGGQQAQRADGVQGRHVVILPRSKGTGVHAAGTGQAQAVEGALVQSVVDGSAADEASLEEGDVIILSDLSRIQDADRIRIR